MRHLRCLVVTDHRAQGRHQHQRAFDELADPLLVRLSTLDQKDAEVMAAVGEKPRGFGDIEDHQRLVDVHLQITGSATDGDRHIVAHHLRRQHGKSLALRRIDLARHDGRAGFVGRDVQLREAATRPAGQESDVVGYLEQ